MESVPGTSRPRDDDAPKGYLGIQGDHPGTLELRNIRIRELQ